MVDKLPRSRELIMYIDNLKSCENLLADHQKEDIQTWELCFALYKDSWNAYESSHYDYFLTLPQEEECTSLQKLHVEEKSKHIRFCTSMESKIKSLTPSKALPLDPFIIAQSMGRDNRAKQFKEDILYKIATIKKTIEGTIHTHAAFSIFSNQAVTLANDIDQTGGFDIKKEREEETEVTNRLLQQR